MMSKTMLRILVSITMMLMLDACGMESSGKKEVLDKEEMGQEVELVHNLAGEQMC